MKIGNMLIVEAIDKMHMNLEQNTNRKKNDIIKINDIDNMNDEFHLQLQESISKLKNKCV